MNVLNCTFGLKGKSLSLSLSLLFQQANIEALHDLTQVRNWEPNPSQVCSDVSTITVNEAYSQESVDRNVACII